MVPRIAQRGHSFKGAGMYYLHDKQAQTKERVLWAHTINLPTQDPDKAFKWMAHTAMNAGRLKKQAGVTSTGRKSKAGEVYSFSLAWHPKQKPDKDTLLQSALETLGLLKLSDHEAVIVAHNDTEHPHVHVICNLVHPESGKTAVPSYDRLTLSSWAENVERSDGEILCEQRVINNQKRREQGQHNKLKFVKHKEKPVDVALVIQDLYLQSDSGIAFQSALAEKGYTLATGDRRGYVLVDEQGKIHSLSRQLKGQRAADIKNRLSGLQDLPEAKTVAFDRQHFDRDKYETERQKKIVDAAIQEDKKRKASPKPTEENKAEQPKPSLQDEHLRKLDALRAWEQKTDREKHRLQQQQEEFYKREDLIKQIHDLENQLSGKENLLDKMTRKRAQLQAQLDALKLSLASIDQRTHEQDKALEIQSLKDKPDESEKPPETLADKQALQKAKKEEYERRMREYSQQKHDRDKDNDLGR